MQAETSYPAIIGRVLELMRRNEHLEQKKVAKYLGITQSAWSRIERGQSGISMEQLLKVGELFGLKPHNILEDADIAKSKLETDGVIVHSNVIAKADNTMALIGLAALGALIFTILRKK